MELFDLHSHALPKIDDGARNSDVSLAMLREAGEQGVSLVALTPHYYSDRQSIDDFLMERDASFSHLKGKISEEGVKTPKLMLGAEVYLTRALSQRDDLERLCYDGTNLLLLELPYGEWGSWVYHEVEKIISHCALTVVLAHPERYVPMPWSFKKLEPFFGMRTILQINADSVLSATHTTKKLLRSGRPCVLGSDSHNTDHRANHMEEAAKTIEHRFGAEVLRDMESIAKHKWGISVEN